MKLRHAVCGHPRRKGHGGEVWQNVVHWRREWQTTSLFLPWESHEQFTSVQFRRSVVSDYLWPHELQHARFPCPSATPGVHPNSCASSRWWHQGIPSSVVPCSSCLQSLPGSGIFPVNQLFAWGGQSTGVSAVASFLPKNTQGWSPLEWTSFFKP